MVNESTSTTVGTAPKIASGIELIDETWGGLYMGGSYLVYGRAAHDRGLMPLLFTSRGGEAASCLYLFSGSRDEVVRRAHGYGLDLPSRQSADLLPLPSFDEPAEVGDDQLASALSEVVANVVRAHPQRVVIDDFMPFVGFYSFDRFRSGFIDMLERIDAIDATLMVIMAEPANDESEAVIDFMRKQMTGALHVTKSGDEPDAPVRRVDFLPNIGHARRQAEREWDIRPWIRPAEPEDRSARRFRFSEDEGPSPRQARWAEADPEEQTHDARTRSAPEGARQGDRVGTPASPRPTESSVPSVRLGTNGPARRESQHQPAADHGKPPGLRIPRIPLGRKNEPREPAAIDPHERGKHVRDVHPAQERPAFRSVTLVDSPHYRTSHTDREAFRDRLQKAFLRNGIDQTPFVLIAMRMERADERDARPFDFDFILDLVSESLREQDDVLVDLARERLVVMLAESGSGASQPFFGRLKQRLREEAPQLADYLMRSVSAIVVPNGRPFRTAEEFLTYALDED